MSLEIKNNRPVRVRCSGYATESNAQYFLNWLSNTYDVLSNRGYTTDESGHGVDSICLCGTDIGLGELIEFASDNYCYCYLKFANGYTAPAEAFTASTLSTALLVEIEMYYQNPAKK